MRVVNGHRARHDQMELDKERASGLARPHVMGLQSAAAIRRYEAFDAGFDLGASGLIKEARHRFKRNLIAGPKYVQGNGRG